MLPLKYAIGINHCLFTKEKDFYCSLPDKRIASFYLKIVVESKGS